MIRSAVVSCFLLAACSSAPPAGPPQGETARRDYWREQVQGAFACHGRNDLDVFLDGIRRLPPRRPRNAGGGSFRVEDQPTVYDDLFPLDEVFDLYVVWNAEEPEKGIKSVEVVGFPDLRARINPAIFDALQALNRSPSAFNGASFDPVLLVRAANAVRALGSQGLPALKAYYDLATQAPYEVARKHSLDAFRIFPVIQLCGSNPSPFRLGAGGVRNPGAATWPLFPMILEQDVPFMVVTDYALGGLPEDPLGRLGPGRSLNPTVLAPVLDPVEAVEALTSSSRWEALAKEQPAREAVELKRRVRRQALEALAPVYRAPDDDARRSCCEDPAEAEWRQVVQEVRALGIRWDPQRQDFVRSR